MAMVSEPLPTVLACGAWLKNSACRLDAGHPVWSASHGDLSDGRACHALEDSARGLIALSPLPIEAVAHDLHPDFFSSRLAVSLARELRVPALAVQHHHAHIAAVQAEHRLEAPVIGLALDGFGLGSDGQAWGGELLWVDATSWRRIGHLWPLALPGGDAAAREPWRMAAAALHALGRGTEIVPRFADAVGAARAQGVLHILERGLNCPGSSSAGRWFDAAAGALGLSVRQGHEAQAACALEHLAEQGLARVGELCNTGVARLVEEAGLVRLDLRPLLDWMLGSAHTERALQDAAAWFHVALADGLAAWAAAAARNAGIEVVCLAGGCFFNRVLTRRLEQDLRRQGLRVLRPIQLSCGDAGLALGQAWVAAQRLRAGTSAAAASESLSCA
jgi:hydrogenase maturation protein HypF